MRIHVTINACSAGGSPHGWLPVAIGTAPGLAHSRTLGIVTLVSWLITEGLGAYMLGTWIASGGMRRQRARPDGLPQPVIFGHVGLAFAGLVAWTSHLVTGSAAPAWLAIGFLFPAIGLGLSTVTVWTPYPARPARAAAESLAGPGDDRLKGQGPSQEGRGGQRADDDPGDHGSGGVASPAEPALAGDVPPGMLTDEMLARTLSDEALTTRLIDDLVASVLAVPAPAAREPKWHLAPLIPAAHGIAAMATFIFAVLAAVAAA